MFRFMILLVFMEYARWRPQKQDMGIYMLKKHRLVLLASILLMALIIGKPMIPGAEATAVDCTITLSRRSVQRNEGNITAEWNFIGGIGPFAVEVWWENSDGAVIKDKFLKDYGTIREGSDTFWPNNLSGESAQFFIIITDKGQDYDYFEFSSDVSRITEKLEPTVELKLPSSVVQGDAITAEWVVHDIPDEVKYNVDVSWYIEINGVFEPQDGFLKLDITNDTAYTASSSVMKDIQGSLGKFWICISPHSLYQEILIEKTFQIVQPPVTALALDATRLQLFVDDSHILTASHAPENAAIGVLEWSSSRPDIASVNNAGQVAAIKAGETTITCKDPQSGLLATCHVTVTQMPTGIVLDKNTQIMMVGSTSQLMATVQPKDAANQSVSWKSGDNTIATVDESGLITAVAPGTVLITAVSSLNEQVTAQCEVIVTQMPTGIEELLIEDVSPKVYSGEAHQPFVVIWHGEKLLAQGQDYLLTYGENTNAGKGSVTVHGTGSYSGTRMLEFDVLPKPISLHWSGTENRAYNGEKSAVSAEVVGLINNDVCAVEIIGGNGINAGSYQAKAIRLSNLNYALPLQTAQPYLITPLQADLSWQNVTDRVYDGEASAVTAVVSNLVKGDVCTVVVEGGAQSDAGKYTVTAIQLSSPNYVLPDQSSHEYEIWPRPAQLIWRGVAQREYDGRPSIFTAHVSNLVPGDVCDVGLEGGTEADAGTHIATASRLSNPNYVLEFEQEQLYIITPRTVQLVWNGAGDRVYDGKPSAVSASIANLLPGDVCEMTVVGATEVLAGGYTATVTSLGNPNYRLPQTPYQPYTIYKAAGNIHAVQDLSKPYDGLAVKEPVCDFTGDGELTFEYFAGEDLEETSAIAVPVQPGLYTVRVTLSEGKNFTGAQAKAAFEIAAQTLVKLVVSPAELTLEKGESADVTAALDSETAQPLEIDWASSDQSIATVNQSGAVQAISPGNAIIFAKARDDETMSASCEVTVDYRSIKGDATGDEQVNLDDLASVIDYLVNGVPATVMKNAETDNVDGVSLSDLEQIIHMVVGS